MTNLRHTVLYIAIATASLGALAQTAAQHTQHHPAELAKKATQAVVSKAPTKSTESMAAKTPEERKALMGDHILVNTADVPHITGDVRAFDDYAKRTPRFFPHIGQTSLT